MTLHSFVTPLCQFCLLLVLANLVGCGQPGPLYLPAKTQAQATPAPSSQPPSESTKKQ
ncbi:LPS translocon maturation chaperone LptM [Methylosoma difficile]